MFKQKTQLSGPAIMRKKGMITNSILALGFLVMLSCKKEQALSNNELINLAAKCGKEGNWPKACEYAKRAVAQNRNDVKGRVMYAIALDHHALVDYALDEAREAVKLDPENFLAQYTLGRILYDNQNYKGCIGPLEKANKLKKNNPFVLVLLAQACRELNNPKALAYFYQLSKTARFSSKPGPHNEVALLLMKKKQISMATREFVKAKSLDPDNPTVALNLAVFLDRTVNNPKAAIRFYQKYLELTEANHALSKKRSEVENRIRKLSN